MHHAPAERISSRDAARDEASRDEVLVVEDDKDFADTLVDILHDEGIASHSVTNGREALDELDGGLRPGVILLDLYMPVMTGWEFLAIMRASKVYRHLPVVVVSGLVNREARAAAQCAFAKTPNLGQLLRAVNHLLG